MEESQKLSIDLMERLKIFLHDLKRYPPYAQERLEHYSSNDPQFYLSLYYFTEDEIKDILNYATPDGSTLRNCMEMLMTERSSQGVVCSSHDLFPIFVRVFSLPKGFDMAYGKRSKRFKGVMKG